MRKRYSLHGISLMLGKEDETLLFDQFLDDFYRSGTKKEKYMLIKDEPVYDAKRPVYMCMLACGAEKLSHDYKIATPAWTQNSKYTLREKAYAFGTQNPAYQKYLEGTTPDEYKKRNLMSGEAVLRRC